MIDIKQKRWATAQVDKIDDDDVDNNNDYENHRDIAQADGFAWMKENLNS